MENVKNTTEMFKIMDIISSGYAGTLPNGNIVDRREFPDAMPVQKNSMFNVPEPKPIETEKA